MKTKIVSVVLALFMAAPMLFADSSAVIIQLFEVKEWRNMCGNKHYSVLLRGNKWGADYFDEVIISSYQEAEKYRFEIYSVPNFTPFPQ